MRPILTRAATPKITQRAPVRIKLAEKDLTLRPGMCGSRDCNPKPLRFPESATARAIAGRDRHGQLGTISAVSDTTTVNVAIPDIMGAFGIVQDLAQWLVHRALAA